MTLREETSKTTQFINVIIASLFIVATMIMGYRNIGLPPVIIVGGSGIVGLIMWYKTYLKRPLDAHIILPPFLLTVAALEVHMIEEYLTRFRPAMSAYSISVGLNDLSCLYLHSSGPRCMR